MRVFVKPPDEIFFSGASCQRDYWNAAHVVLPCRERPGLLHGPGDRPAGGFRGHAADRKRADHDEPPAVAEVGRVERVLEGEAGAMLGKRRGAP
jgi:hypothetical protein